MYLGGTLMSLEEENALPQNIFDAGLQYRQGPFRMNLAFRHASRNAKPSLEDEDYTVLDGRVQYSVLKYLDLFVDVDNITDTRYVTFEGFGTKAVNVGRLVMVGGRLKYP